MGAAGLWVFVLFVVLHLSLGEDKPSDYSGVRGVIIGGLVGVLMVLVAGFGLILAVREKWINDRRGIDSSFIEPLIGLLLFFVTVGVFICVMVVAIEIDNRGRKDSSSEKMPLSPPQLVENNEQQEEE